MCQVPLCLQTVNCSKKNMLKVQTEKFFFIIILCPLLAKGVLVPLDVAPRGAPWLLGNGLVAPGVVTHGPSAVLEAALGGPLVLMTTVKLTLTSHIAPWLATTSHTWLASNTSARTTSTSTTTTRCTSCTCRWGPWRSRSSNSATSSSRDLQKKKGEIRLVH